MGVRSEYRVVTLAPNTDAIALPASNRRRAVWMYVASTTGVVNFAWGRPATTITDAGMFIYGGPYKFTKKALGGLIDAELHLISNVTISVGIIVTYDS